MSESDLEGIHRLAELEISHVMCRAKLAEVIEKLMKAELIRLGWFLEKTHDLRKLFGEMEARGSDLAAAFRPLATAYAEVYFMARYPGFDLPDPDWQTLRKDVAEVSELLDRINRKLT
jgi:HEPN domain-containing protein